MRLRQRAAKQWRYRGRGSYGPFDQGGSSFLTLRYLPNGTLDPGFGNSGYATQKYSSDGNDGINAVAIQSDGNIVVAGTAAAGNTDSNFALARYDGDPTVVATGVAVAATAGVPFTGPVATFTDADSLATAGGFTATIDWGDGGTSAGVVSSDGSGGFVVSGTYTYGRCWQRHRHGADPVRH